MSGYVNTAERVERLGQLRTWLLKHKEARGLTYREIGLETGLSTAEVHNAANHVARFDVCARLEHWCASHEG